MTPNINDAGRKGGRKNKTKRKDGLEHMRNGHRREEMRIQKNEERTANINEVLMQQRHKQY